MPGRIYAGVAGFGYPSWRGSFYPAGARHADFLRLYAERLPSVELAGVFYRIPARETIARWAAQTPEGFRFAVKLNRRIAVFRDLRAVPAFAAALSALGDKLGPVRAQLPGERDDAFLAELLEAFEPAFELALDLADPSWDAPEVDALLEEAGAARVNRLERGPGFRYLRLREPPYDEDALAALAAELRPVLSAGVDVYCYFKHEDEPRGARYAERLLALLADAT